MLKGSKKRKGKKNKNKNNNDDVDELNMGNTEYNTTEMGHTTQGANDTQEPLAGKKKKKKKRDKNKGKQDELVSAGKGAGGPDEEYVVDVGNKEGKSTSDPEKGKKTKGSSDEPSGSSSSDKKDGKDKKKKKKSKNADGDKPGGNDDDLL